MIQTIRRPEFLTGAVQLPGDKSISHRYAMLAALAEGASRIHRFAGSQDCRSTLGCLKALGASVQADVGAVIIEGRGLGGLKPPSVMLDAGNSGTTLRLLSGILAGQRFRSCIGGDASLVNRPMERVARPLRMMGAQVETQPGGLPPLTIAGGGLKAIRYTLPVASAQVKSCILLAGLYADGTTAVEEPVPTRDHTEIALRCFGAQLKEDGGWIEVEPRPALRPQVLNVPGDLSGAAFFLAAAALVPGAEILMPGVGLNGRRRALLDYLQRGGLSFSVEHEREEAGEPRGDLRVRYSAGFLESELPPIAGSLVAGLIDEIPVLAVLGSQVKGGLTISDAGELRLKESDRITAIADNLGRMGAAVEETPDGLRIRGGQRLIGASIDSRGDHRIAMAFGVAGLAAEGETRIGGAECADVSFPAFWETLSALTYPSPQPE